MIDGFTIFTTGGVVLWQKTVQPIATATMDSLISEIFIEDRAGGSSMTKNRYTVHWTTSNDLGLIFVAVYQSLLQITFIDELLSSVKKLFSTIYLEELTKKEPESLPVCKFDDYFNVRYAELEQKSSKKSSAPVSPVAGEIDAETETEAEAEGGSADEAAAETSDLLADSAPAAAAAGLKKKKAKAKKEKLAPVKKGKQMRRWGVDGSVEDYAGEEGSLDYSGGGDASESMATSAQLDDDAAVAGWGSKTKSGDFILKELSSEINDILATADDGKAKEAGAAATGFSFLKGIIGNKTLSDGDLDKALVGMKEHLMKKNVAPEVAAYLCDTVKESLLGTKTSSWTSVEKTVRGAMEDALRKILTPSTSVDLLHEIQKVRNKRPYVISVVGVNGVGKSTNLSKIAFWLLQNDMKILVAACDTFRSGAVEQLRVHARNLTQLTQREGGQIELFEKGYGKDAAVIAQDAITYATSKKYDVVLIDTAGRRHNDKRLMSSLEKFAKLAQPDKIIMVGEALVGTDSVQQARNFNAAFGQARQLDFFLISKCDTVGDMIGSMVNMTYSTGIPVLFVGTGQMYTDLRTLSVSWAVGMLMA
ncbi:SRP54-type protein [Dipodascopsis tothii]|uniref:SRP54-type protein n=1 Tax=Dipodascopsis tothii TaxID=44089 RepID=UPI0034CF244E